MNQITDKPNRYTFGESFNYATWPKDTELTLTNVPWNNDYRDVIRFPTQGALDTWIDGQPRHVIENTSEKKFQRLTARINLPINEAMEYNYLRAKNPLNPVHGDTARNYYYFIQNVAWISGNTTELTLQLDVWQTFGYEVTFGNCYIERGHIGIANENAFDNYGRDYLSIPEGLDVGGEYRIVKTAREQVMTLDDHSILVCSTQDLTKNPGTVKAPKLVTSAGSIVDGLASGAAFYVFPTPDDFSKFMKHYAELPWVTEGIISVTLVPSVSRYHPGAALQDVAADVVLSTMPIDPATGLGGFGTTGPDFTMYAYPSGPSTLKTTALANNWRDSFLDFLPAEYRGLKKLLTYPYSVIEVTTWTGQPLIVRPEAWADDDATIRERAVMMPPGQRVAFMPYRYNADAVTSPDGEDDHGEDLDFATTLDSFPSVPLVNNMYVGYLAANRNGLAFQFSSADWSQQKALRGAQATADIAGADIRNTSRQARIGARAETAQAELSASTMQVNAAVDSLGKAAGSVSAGLTGFAVAGPAGAAMAIAPAATQAVAQNLEAANTANAIRQGATIANAARMGSAGSSNQLTADVRDTNVSLAQFAARGDYQNAVAGVNAKIQDARLNQPSTSGQFGGDAMNLAHSRTEVAARWKMIDNSALRRVGNFWLRYGYAVDQFATIPADFMCMSKFTYWKLSETYVTRGNIPETFKQTIRGIFEKGVTVWANPDYVGTTRLSDNTPRNGITY